MTDFTIILRSMRARLFSTVTTVLTVAVAVGLMLLLLSLRDAGRAAFDRGSGNMHLLISRDPSPLVAVLNGIFYTNAPQRPIDWAKYQELRATFPWEWAIPTQLGDSYRGYPVMATEAELFTRFEPVSGRPWRLQSGRYFEGPFEIVIGATVARHAGLRVGDAGIFLTHGIEGSRERLIGRRDEPEAMTPHIHYDFEYRVVGILEPTGAAHDRALFTDLKSSWIIHAHDRRQREDPSITTTTADDLLDEDRLITGIYARLPTRPGATVPAALQQVHDMLRRDVTITVAQPADEIRKLFTIVSALDQLFIAMAAVVMVSSGIAIMLALYNSMEQRRRQIAVLRVLGSSRQRISSLVLTESALIGVFGAVAGVLLAVGGGQVASGLMRQTLGLIVEPRLGLEWTLLTIMGTILLASLAGVIPSIVAYRTPVAKNLRPIG